MIRGIEGKTVAVVGRAGSLIGSGNGAAIDSCFVIRVNWMLPLDEALAVDIGTRTDMLYHAMTNAEGIKAAARAAGVPTVQGAIKLRRRLPKSLQLDPNVYRPTSGVVAIFDALRSGAEAVYAFGFDLYATLYVGEPYTGPAAPPFYRDGATTWQHDQNHDRRLLHQLLSDDRFHPDPILLAALLQQVAA